MIRGYVDQLFNVYFFVQARPAGSSSTATSVSDSDRPIFGCLTSSVSSASSREGGGREALTLSSWNVQPRSSSRAR